MAIALHCKDVTYLFSNDFFRNFGLATNRGGLDLTFMWVQRDADLVRLRTDHVHDPQLVMAAKVTTGGLAINADDFAHALRPSDVSAQSIGRVKPPVQCSHARGCRSPRQSIGGAKPAFLGRMRRYGYPAFRAADDPMQNMHRFYRKHVTPGIFNDGLLVRERWRIGSPKDGQKRLLPDR